MAIHHCILGSFPGMQFWSRAVGGLQTREQDLKHPNTDVRFEQPNVRTIFCSKIAKINLQAQLIDNFLRF